MARRIHPDAMTRTEARGVVVRLLIGLPLLLWLVWSHGTAIAQSSLPLFHLLLGWAVSHLGELRLDVVFQAPQYQFAAAVTVEKLTQLNGQVLPVGTVLHASAPVYVALVPLLIVTGIALAWPGLTWRGRLLRLAISAPFVFMLEIIDVPMVLAIALCESVGAAGSTLPPWVGWIMFMDGGGRYALAMAAALLVADVHTYFASRHN